MLNATPMTSRDIACERLRRVILKDHLSITSEAMELMRVDVRDVLAQYAELADEDLSMAVEQGSAGADLVIRTRINGFKRAGKGG